MKKVLFFLLFLFSVPAFAAPEEILNYQADIRVEKDASVIVTERITVQREGIKIRRGIYRDLPRTRGVTYSVFSVKRNGSPEPYFTENKGSIFRINTGNNDFLPYNGIYTFEIIYRASNVILGFDNYDELYWNVTGNGWDFPIRSAGARVFLPGNAAPVQQAVYIGRHGSKERGIETNGLFTPGRSLETGEGMTVAVGFDKGLVDLPPVAFYENLPIERAVKLSALIFFSYLLITWALYGKDPEKEAIMPRFNGLPDLTPAQAGWIYSYGKNKDGCLTAALLQGAVSGFLNIREDSSFHITRLRDGKNGEEKFFEHNLAFPLNISDKYTQKMEKFMKSFQEFLSNKTGEIYFTSNTKLIVFGLLLLLGITAYLGYLANILPLIPILAFYLLFFIPAAKGLTKMFATRVFLFSPIIILVFISVHFSFMSFSFIANNPDARMIILFYALSCLALLFYSHLIIRPTKEGSRVIAHLDGIKMFLTAVDTNLPKEAEVNHIEKLLPYAVLFGLEKEWDAKMKELTNTENYKPKWYSGRRFSSMRFGGLCTAVTASCSRPSRSGSGGGGFSGGGFGGGGGGGR